MTVLLIGSFYLLGIRDPVPQMSGRSGGDSGPGAGQQSPGVGSGSINFEIFKKILRGKEFL